MPRLVAAGQTHPGRQRPLNEDAWQIAPEADTGHRWAARGRLYAVADGMGGHAAGEVASQLALDTLLQQYYNSDETPLPPAIRLERAVLEANLDIYEQAVAVDAQAGMGTTLVAAVIHEDRLTVANVGDSRAYLVRDGEAIQITEDHSWVAEQVKLGVMTDEQAENHAYRNVVTRCLGHKPGIQVDIFEHRLQAGDAILLCSDGLSNQVPADEIARVVTGHTPDESTDKLVDLANRAGGPDNITALVVQVVALSTAPAGAPARRRTTGANQHRYTGRARPRPTQPHGARGRRAHHAPARYPHPTARRRTHHAAAQAGHAPVDHHRPGGRDGDRRAHCAARGKAHQSVGVACAIAPGHLLRTGTDLAAGAIGSTNAGGGGADSAHRGNPALQRKLGHFFQLREDDRRSGQRCGLGAQDARPQGDRPDAVFPRKGNLFLPEPTLGADQEGDALWRVVERAQHIAARGCRDYGGVCTVGARRGGRIPMPLPRDQRQIAGRRVSAGVGKRERIGKARQAAAPALLGGLADDPLPAGPLTGPTLGGSGHAALRLGRHKGGHPQLCPLLQDPLKALPLEHALV
jgi:serine/threonine protein phosphatase PrpC